MKELIEQYNRIQAMATGLRHVSQDIPGLVDDHTIEVMINKIGLRMHTLAHEIVRELQQQLNGDAEQPNEPVQAGKPELTVWCLKNKVTGKYLACQYVIQLFRSHNDAWSHRTWFSDKVDWIPEVYDGTQDAEWNVKGPKPIDNDTNKPLWTVIAAGEPDYEARSRGIMGSSKYRMFFTKEDALESIGDSIDKKVVPVWGE
jgi:hypothetical protein